jgi:hypothetical protein
MQFVAQKAFGIAAVNGSVVEVLTMFVLGILVCTVIYSACALYEGALSRRKDTMEWNHSATNTVDRLSKG